MYTEKTLTENSAKEWCERWLHKQDPEVDHDTGIMLMELSIIHESIDADPRLSQVLYMNNDQINELTDEGEIVLMRSLAPMVARRVRYCWDYDLTNTAVIGVATICHNPAQVTMLCTLIQYQCQLHNQWKIDLGTLLLWFQRGFYSDDTLTEMWSDQKIKDYNIEDNMLDRELAVKSLRKRILEP